MIPLAISCVQSHMVKDVHKIIKLWAGDLQHYNNTNAAFRIPSTLAIYLEKFVHML